MKAEYKRDINHNYLILEDEKGMDRSSYQVRMLLGNVIPSILRCHLQNLDGKNFYSYEITSKQSVAYPYASGRIPSCDGRAGGISDESGTASDQAGVYLSGHRVRNGFLLLSAGTGRRGADTAQGIYRIYAPKTGS